MIATPPQITRTWDITNDKDVAVYQNAAEFARLFADPIRIELIDALSQSPRSVDSLSRVCAIPLKTVSHHLQKLLGANLLTRTKRGRHAVYAIADKSVISFVTQLRQVQQHLQTAFEPFTLAQHGDRIHTANLLPLVRHHKVRIIDVRPPEEFANGHIPGAISVPAEQLQEHLNRIPNDKPVVAFCRGPYCKLADHAVRVLKKKGYSAIRCDEGVAELVDAGIALEKTPTANTDK